MSMPIKFVAVSARLNPTNSTCLQKAERRGSSDLTIKLTNMLSGRIGHPSHHQIDTPTDPAGSLPARRGVRHSLRNLPGVDGIVDDTRRPRNPAHHERPEISERRVHPPHVTAEVHARQPASQRQAHRMSQGAEEAHPSLGKAVESSAVMSPTGKHQMSGNMHKPSRLYRGPAACTSPSVPSGPPLTLKNSRAARRRTPRDLAFVSSSLARRQALENNGDGSKCEMHRQTRREKGSGKGLGMGARRRADAKDDVDGSLMPFPILPHNILHTQYTIHNTQDTIHNTAQTCHLVADVHEGGMKKGRGTRNARNGSRQAGWQSVRHRPGEGL